MQKAIRIVGDINISVNPKTRRSYYGK